MENYINQYTQEEDQSINIPEISISYLVTVKDEINEIQKLIPHLLKYKRPQDEIVVLWDENGDLKVWEYVIGFEEIRHYRDYFQNHFADWKNKGTSQCKGDFIIQIDADEIPNEGLMRMIHWLIHSNPEVDVFQVPRINIVKNLGLSHVKKWGWGISRFRDQDYNNEFGRPINPYEKYIEEKEFDLSNPQDLDEYNLLKEYNLIISVLEHSTINNQKTKLKFYTPIVNFSDPQWRIYRNNGKIKWINKVHERLDGFSNYSHLPSIPEYCLEHIKQLDRQEKQNNYYNTL